MTYKQILAIVLMVALIWGINRSAFSDPGNISLFSGKIVASGGYQSYNNLRVHGVVGDLVSGVSTNSNGSIVLISGNIVPNEVSTPAPVPDTPTPVTPDPVDPPTATDTPTPTVPDGGEGTPSAVEAFLPAINKSYSPPRVICNIAEEEPNNNRVQANERGPWPTTCDEVIATGNFVDEDTFLGDFYDIFVWEQVNLSNVEFKLSNVPPDVTLDFQLFGAVELDPIDSGTATAGTDVILPTRLDPGLYYIAVINRGALTTSQTYTVTVAK